MNLDYLEDIFEDEYLADDGSDYKNEIDNPASPTVFASSKIILPDWSKGV